MTLVPEAWQNDELMAEYKKDFYKWLSCSIEPWDGPGTCILSMKTNVRHQSVVVNITFYSIF